MAGESRWSTTVVVALGTVYESNTAEVERKHENHERGHLTGSGSPDCHESSDRERSHRTLTLGLVIPTA